MHLVRRSRVIINHQNRNGPTLMAQSRETKRQGSSNVGECFNKKQQAVLSGLVARTIYVV